MPAVFGGYVAPIAEDFGLHAARAAGARRRRGDGPCPRRWARPTRGPISLVLQVRFAVRGHPRARQHGGRREPEHLADAGRGQPGPGERRPRGLHGESRPRRPTAEERPTGAAPSLRTSCRGRRPTRTSRSPTARTGSSSSTARCTTRRTRSASGRGCREPADQPDAALREDAAREPTPLPGGRVKSFLSLLMAHGVFIHWPLGSGDAQGTSCPRRPRASFAPLNS